MTGTVAGKVWAGEVGAEALVVVFRVVEALGAQEEPGAEKDFRQVEASQWSLVLPHCDGLEGYIKERLFETYPSILRAAVVVLARDVAVLRTAVLGVDLSEDTRSEGKDSDSSELHYDYDLFL